MLGDSEAEGFHSLNKAVTRRHTSLQENNASQFILK